jgi:WD40 repeat protein
MMKPFLRILSILTVLGFITACTEDRTPTEQWTHSELGSYAASFSPDRQTVLVGDTDLPAKLWDIESNQIRHSWQNLPDETGTTTGVGFSADGKVAATNEQDTFVLWNMADGEPMVRLSFPYKVRDFALSPHGDYLLVALADRTAVYFDVIENRVVYIFEHDGEPVSSPINQLINTVAISSDGKWALTGGDDRTARLWNLETGEQHHQWLHGNVVSLVSFHPSNAYAITSAANDHTVFRSLADPKRYVVLNKTNFDLDSVWADFPVFKTTTSAVAYSPDGKLIATGHPNQMICVWATNGKNLACWTAPRKDPLKPGVVLQALAFSPDGKFIYSESGNGLGQKWRIQ